MPGALTGDTPRFLKRQGENQTTVTDEPKEQLGEELEPDELEGQEGKELPERELISIIDVGNGGLAPPEFGPPPELSDPTR
jgi:hypothetical protein